MGTDSKKTSMDKKQKAKSLNEFTKDELLAALKLLEVDERLSDKERTDIDAKMDKIKAVHGAKIREILGKRKMLVKLTKDASVSIEVTTEVEPCGDTSLFTTFDVGKVSVEAADPKVRSAVEKLLAVFDDEGVRFVDSIFCDRAFDKFSGKDEEYLQKLYDTVRNTKYPVQDFIKEIIAL